MRKGETDSKSISNFSFKERASSKTDPFRTHRDLNEDDKSTMDGIRDAKVKEIGGTGKRRAERRELDVTLLTSGMK